MSTQDDLEREIARLSALVSMLRMRKTRRDATRQTVIASAVESLDGIEDAAAFESDAEPSWEARFVFIRRVLREEHDAYDDEV